MLESSYAHAIDTERPMETVTVSPKYQIVIPKSIREALDLKPGQKLEMIMFRGAVHLVPSRSIEELCGVYPELDPNVPKEPDPDL
jgi:AbrB family looped-hinge helix DNA binding protein